MNDKLCYRVCSSADSVLANVEDKLGGNNYRGPPADWRDLMKIIGATIGIAFVLSLIFSIHNLPKVALLFGFISAFSVVIGIVVLIIAVILARNVVDCCLINHKPPQ